MSYASEDNYFALRLYDDLKRSGLSVWRYEHDSQRARNFREEYRQELENSDFFLLIDSPEARKSGYVAEEIQLGWEKFSKTYQFIICIKGENGTWREKFDGLVQPGLLEALNGISYFQFPKGEESDTFESDDRYKKVVGELIGHFGMDFIPWAPYPWLYDLQKEFYNTINSLDIPGAEVLLNDFRNANYYWTTGDLDQAEHRFRNLSTLCEKYGLISPSMLLGAVFFDQGNIKEANNTYQTITQKFPHDPRGWYGLGLSFFYLSRYPLSEKAFMTALKKAEKQISNPFHQHAKGRLIASLALVRIKQNKFEQARKHLDTLNKEDRDLPETKSAAILLHLKEGNYPAAIELYKSIEYVYKNSQNNAPYLNLLLVQIDMLFAQHYQQTHSTWNLAAGHFERAASIQPKNIRFHAELAALYFKLNLHEKQRATISRGLNLEPETTEEWYFTGLLYYLDRNHKQANSCFASAKSTGWPHYELLVGKMI